MAWLGLSAKVVADKLCLDITVCQAQSSRSNARWLVVDIRDLVCRVQQRQLPSSLEQRMAITSLNIGLCVCNHGEYADNIADAVGML